MSCRNNRSLTHPRTHTIEKENPQRTHATINTQTAQHDKTRTAENHAALENHEEKSRNEHLTNEHVKNREAQDRKTHVELETNAN